MNDGKVAIIIFSSEPQLPIQKTQTIVYGQFFGINRFYASFIINFANFISFPYIISIKPLHSDPVFSCQTGNFLLLG